MTKTQTRPCPVRRCPETIPPTRLLCPGHWRQVPAALRHDVWDTWNNDPGSLAHAAACRAAIEAVNARQETTP